MPKYDLLLQGGTVIDPANGRHEKLDVAITGQAIAAVAAGLPAGDARRVERVEGKIVTPGWIDIHAHVFAGCTSWGIKPDPATIPAGVTTVVDAGSPGWTMLSGFRWLIHEPSIVRALTFLHISGVGLVNAWVNEMEDIRHAHPDTVGALVRENSDMVVGVKVRQGKGQVGENGTRPMELAIEAAEMADAPVMCHIATGIPITEVLRRLRPGDIITHCFQGRGDAIVDEDSGEVLPATLEARERGVVMDVGHGGGSFRWGVAEACLEAGFLPDVISSDLHAYNLYGPAYDLAHIASKFLYLGLSLDQVVAAVTSGPAQAIRRPELGRLDEGGPADVAVYSLSDDPTPFFDTHGDERIGRRGFLPELTVRAGKVYRPADFTRETPEEIARRCRIRKPGGEIEVRIYGRSKGSF